MYESNDVGIFPGGSGRLAHDRAPAQGSTRRTAVLAEIWLELVSGHRRILDVPFSKDRCGLVLSRGGARAPRALSARNHRILLRVLTGSRQKVAASETGLTGSSLAVILKQCLAALGVGCLPRKVPLAVVIAAHAYAAGDTGLIVETEESSDGSVVVAMIERPDRYLEPLLSRAEYEVTRLLIEGQSYAEIARARACSERTVANQIAAAYQRLHISGRAELLSLVAGLCGRPAALPPQPPLPPPPAATGAAARPRFPAGSSVGAPQLGAGIRQLPSSPPPRSAPSRSGSKDSTGNMTIACSP